MTTVAEHPSPAASGRNESGPQRVGEMLRQKRESLGWDLADVATALRIRLAYLQALESGDLRQLPGNAYALGFLRTYATTLGLDAEQVTRRFRDETKDVNRKPELAFPAPVPERGIPAGALVLLGLVVIAGAYIGYYRLSDHERTPSQTVPAVPTTLAPYANGTRPPPPSPQVASVLPEGQQAAPPAPLPADRHPVPPQATAPVAGQGDLQPAPAQPAPTPMASAPSAAISGGAAAVAPQVPLPPAAAPASAAAPTPVPAPGQTTASAAPASVPGSALASAPGAPPVPLPAANMAAVPPDQITLVAKATSWVQVRQDGKVIYDHILKAGDSWTAPATGGPLTLTTGNAGGLAVALGGVEGGVLGKAGAVRRNLPLDAATLRSGALAAAAPGPAPVPSAAAPSAGGLTPNAGAAPSAGAPAPDAPAPSPAPDAPAPSPAQAAHRRAPHHAPVDSGVSADDLNARQLRHTP